ncbi:hypothetical protein PX52LOC_02257 [Limnoglobus roseus]|uniref:Uncharacterized protein n=1 Tax=Limnoglobus roseus TaxID=2598579 RepID=A0A5C1AC14_9BACT|nr:hypothetical protein PX52LOC_02257 [Limnoglobus roseus]
MAITRISAQVHGREIEIGCYGSGSDWLCRLTDPSSQLEKHTDIYSPPPDLGFFWLRESDWKWLASGLVNREVFRDTETVDKLLERLMREVVGIDQQLAQCIEFVSAEFTATADGEQGTLQFPGKWAESRWWQSR